MPIDSTFASFSRRVAAAFKFMGVFLCKAALCLALVPVSAESELKEGAAKTIVEQDWHGGMDDIRREVVPAPSRCSKIALATRGRISAAERVDYLTVYDGHRLSNGYLAPLTC